MKKLFNLKILIFILILVSTFHNIFSVEDKLEIYSPNYFNEQHNIYNDIHYIENEYLGFKFCTDPKAKNIQSSLECSQNNSIPLILKDYTQLKGCYFSNFNLKQATCENFSLKIKYNLNNKEREITRDFKKQKQSKLINYVLGKDYTTLNPVSLSYYLIVLNNLETINSKKSIEVYNLLKNSRNNLNKCWPNGNCNVSTTVKILRNLKLSGYSLNSRLLDDGKNYLENNMINNQNNPLKFTINISKNFNGSDVIYCNLSVDNGLPRTYMFDSNDTGIEKYASNSIKFDCNAALDKIEFRLYNLNGITKNYIEYDDKNSFTYTIPKYSCIGTNENCDYGSSINALITYGSSLTNANLVANYINSLIIKNDGETYFNSNNEYTDIGKLLYYNNNKDLLEHLKFNQNNDGSWGTRSIYDRIKQTAWSILGLQKSIPSSEYVSDGKKWVYYNEPPYGWGDIEKNTLAYLAIKEQIKPYIEITAKNEIKGTTNFTIYNPTIYHLRNLKLKLSKEINNYVSYSENLGNLNAEENSTFNITLDKNFYGKLTGELLITGIDSKNKKLTLTKMPINLQGNLPFTIPEKQYVLSNGYSTLNLEIKKNNPEIFDIKCSYLDPFDNLKKEINITQSTNTLSIQNLDLKKGEFETSLNCNYNKYTFSIPVKFNISISKKSFDIAKKTVLLTSPEDFSINVKNILKNKQVITAEILGTYKNIIVPTEPEKLIAANDTREMFFTIKNPTLLKALENSSTGSILLKGENGYVRKISINTDFQSTAKSGINWMYVILSIIVIFGIIIIILRYLRFKTRELEENEYDLEDDEEIYI